MTTSYPGAFDSLVNPTATDSLDSATVPHAAQHANANDAIEAIQITLGINPQGSGSTVVARLNTLDSTVGTANSTANTALANAATAQSTADTKVASVSGSSPISVTTGTTPTVSIAAASTSVSGAVQLTDSISSTSITTAATPASVKSAYDLAATKAGTGTANTFTTGTQIIATGSDSTVGFRIKRNSATQSANIFEITQSDGTSILAKIDSAGAITAPQVSIQATSISTVPMVIKPTGSLTITSLTATHSGGAGVAYDTVSGFSSTIGLVAGQSVVLSGFSDPNFNGPTTITLVQATTIRVASLQNTNGTGTGGRIVVAATQQNLQEWQYNTGTAVASIGASGIVTASSFSGSGASLTSLSGGNLVDNSVTATKLATNALAPTLWYSPTSSYTTPALTAVSGTSNFVDAFGLTNGVTVGNNKTYYVEYVFVGNVTHTASTSTGIRVNIAGDAVSNIGFDAMQASLATSPNGNWASTTNYSSYINAINTNYQIGGSIVTGTSIFFKLTLRGIMRTGSSGAYFQPKLGLSTVSASGTSTITIARESYASLIELGTSSATTQGTWA